MSDKETVFNEELGTWELCTVCLDVAFDAAFSDGFLRDDRDDQYILIDEDMPYDELDRSKIVRDYYDG